MTLDQDDGAFRIQGGLWDGRNLYDLYDEAHTPWGWHEELFALGRKLGVTVFSAPFDASAVSFLEGLDAPAYKIASFEIVDLPLVRRVASTEKPLILSTGMASRSEVVDAVETARDAGCEHIVLLHCVSGYPTPPEEADLRTLIDLPSLGVPVGLSDHTHGVAVPIAGVACGAAIIEKHVTLRRSDGGLDAAFSLEPDELAQLCDGVRTAWQALGKSSYARRPSEEPNAAFRRSLYIVEDVAEGDLLTDSNVRSIRPGFGLEPKRLPEVLGRRAPYDLPRGTPLSDDAVDWPRPSN
jgi:N-acetylneuraminate synthase